MVSLLLSTSLLVSAGPKQKKVDNWIDASVKQKSCLFGEGEHADHVGLDQGEAEGCPDVRRFDGAGSVGACYGRRTGWYGLGLGYMGECPFNQGGR